MDRVDGRRNGGLNFAAVFLSLLALLASWQLPASCVQAVKRPISLETVFRMGCTWQHKAAIPNQWSTGFATVTLDPVRSTVHVESTLPDYAVQVFLSTRRGESTHRRFRQFLTTLQPRGLKEEGRSASQWEREIHKGDTLLIAQGDEFTIKEFRTIVKEGLDHDRICTDDAFDDLPNAICLQVQETD